MNSKNMFLPFNRPRPALLALALLIGLAGNAFPLATAHAATFAVTTTADTDDGACNADCSLREAIAASNATAAADTIHVPAGSYGLTLGMLTIEGPLTLRGAGSGATMVDGNGASRVLAVMSGHVTIERVTIQGGSSGEGSGIENRATLRLRASVLRNNVAAEDGGAIRNFGTLSVVHSAIHDNQAETGAAIYNVGSLTITHSSIVGNQAAYVGGGLRNAMTARLERVTLDGNTAGGVGADGQGGAVFNEQQASVEFRRVTLKDNRAQGDNSEGGGVYNAGRMTLAHSALSTNLAAWGGGLRTSGSLEMFSVSLTGNHARVAGGALHNSGTVLAHSGTIAGNTAGDDQFGGNGGGVFNADGSTLQFSQALVSDNLATSEGGGVFNAEGATGVIDRSQVLRNQAADGSGGGVRNDGSLAVKRSTIGDNMAGEDGGGGMLNRGTLVVERSTISGNWATEQGGGLYHNAGSTTLVNSTISGNQAAQHGGGIYANAGTLQLANVTITANRADADEDEWGVGGGIANQPLDAVAASFTLTHTILAGNRDVTGDGPDCWGSFHSLGYNLIQNTFDCSFTGDTATNIVGQDARLAPLANQGGPTRTHALLPGSPAIDTGSPAGCTDAAGNPLTVDQRGVHRPQGTRCDIGAFERAPHD